MFTLSTTYMAPAYLPLRLCVVLTIPLTVACLVAYVKRQTAALLVGTLATYVLGLPVLVWACECDFFRAGRRAASCGPSLGC